jgi:hypothetical protein
LRDYVSTCCLAVVLLSASLLAQNIVTAQLSGSVRDQTGAAIANASITATNDSKGISRSTISDAAGNYQLLLLPPGTYTVTAVSPGFAQSISKNIVLTVGEQGALPLKLSISSSESVTVNSSANIIVTQGSSQSTTVDQLSIDNLPTNGRNYINFATH